MIGFSIREQNESFWLIAVIEKTTPSPTKYNYGKYYLCSLILYILIEAWMMPALFFTRTSFSCSHMWCCCTTQKSGMRLGGLLNEDFDSKDQDTLLESHLIPHVVWWRRFVKDYSFGYLLLKVIATFFSWLFITYHSILKTQWNGLGRLNITFPPIK